MLLAVFGAIAAAIHQSLHLSLPAELAVAYPPAIIYSTVRTAVIRQCLGWTLGLLILPIAAFELLHLVPYLLRETYFLVGRDWTYYGLILGSWLALAVLLAMLVQWLVLLRRDRGFMWHMSTATMLLVCIFLLWFVANTAPDNAGAYGVVVIVLMAAAAVVLRRATQRPPVEFGEAIADRPGHAAQALK